MFNPESGISDIIHFLKEEEGRTRSQSSDNEGKFVVHIQKGIRS